MASKLGGDQDDIIADINITPFVDIILVVLIIFMVAAPMLDRQSIKVTLPEAATGENTETTSLGLMLDASGNLYLDGAATEPDALRAYIRQEKAKKADLICLIAADQATPHGKVVGLIDLVKQEGVTKFAINIEPVQLPPEAPDADALPATTP